MARFIEERVPMEYSVANADDERARELNFVLEVIVCALLSSGAPHVKPCQIASQLGITPHSVRHYCRQTKSLRTWQGQYTFLLDDPKHVEAMRDVIRLALWGKKKPVVIKKRTQRSSLSAFIAVLFATLPAHAQEVTTELQGLLQAPFQPQPLWFASTDPKNDNFDYVLLKPGETRRIPLAAGTLLRLRSTAQFPDAIELRLQTARGRITPIWTGGKALSGSLSNKAYTLFPVFDYEPLAKLDKTAALFATNRAKGTNKWYFQASVRPLKDVLLPVLPRVTSISGNGLTVHLPRNSEREFGNFTTPGLIYELNVAVDEGSTEGIFEQVRLRASFDGQRAVDAPLLALAGQERGNELGKNAVSDFDGSRLKLLWPMPFKTAKLSLYNPTNRDLKFNVQPRVQNFDQEPSKVRFCALEQSQRTKKGEPIPILNVKGTGAFAGLALSIAPDEGSPRQGYGFLEGNETITIDGAPYEGTGTEDFFNSAWYFPDKPFLDQYNGLSFKSQKPPATSAYRFHVLDPMPFKRDLKFDFEVGRHNNFDDLNWKWTAMWYQIPPLRLPIASSADAPNGASPLATDAPTGGLSNGWKIALAVLAGLGLGTFSALRKIRRKRRA